MTSVLKWSVAILGVVALVLWARVNVLCKEKLKVDERLNKLEFRRNLTTIKMQWLADRVRSSEEGLPPPPEPTYGDIDIDYLLADATGPSQWPPPPGWRPPPRKGPAPVDDRAIPLQTTPADPVPAPQP